MTRMDRAMEHTGCQPGDNGQKWGRQTGHGPRGAVRLCTDLSSPSPRAAASRSTAENRLLDLPWIYANRPSVDQSKRVETVGLSDTG